MLFTRLFFKLTGISNQWRRNLVFQNLLNTTTFFNGLLRYQNQ